MQKPAHSTLINICIIPSEPVGQACIELSKTFDDATTTFVLGSGKFAHMTLYMARFADESIAEIVAEVAATLQAAKPFNCQQSGYFLTSGNYVEVSYRKTSELMALHQALMSNVAGYRINPGNPYLENYFAPYTTDQRSNAEKTGYDLAGDLYRPHISLTRYKEGMAPAEMPTLPARNLSFETTKIAIYKADDNGSIYELIQEFYVG